MIIVINIKKFIRKQKNILYYNKFLNYKRMAIILSNFLFYLKKIH